jgi:hypothetical protein
VSVVLRANSLRWIAAGCGLLYLTLKVIESVGTGGLDFRLIWIAGEVWSAGDNPYSPAFHAAYGEHFGPVLATAFWTYPPYWFPIATAFAALPFHAARVAWTAMNAALLLASCVVVARTLGTTAGRDSRALLLEGVAFACFLQASPVCLSLGQTSILLCFGASLVFAGMVRDRAWLTLAGGILLALKPHVGVVLLAGAFARGPRRWPSIAAGAVALGAVLPIGIAGDLAVQTSGFLSALARYRASELAANGAPNLTGAVHLADWMGLPPLVSGTWVLVACALALALGFSQRNAESAQARVALFGALLSIALLFVPLHSYDMVALVVLALIARSAVPAGWPAIALGLLVAFRPGNLVKVFGAQRSESAIFPESPIVSLALVAIAAGFAFGLATTTRHSRLSPSASTPAARSRAGTSAIQRP